MNAPLVRKSLEKLFDLGWYCDLKPCDNQWAAVTKKKVYQLRRFFQKRLRLCQVRLWLKPSHQKTSHDWDKFIQKVCQCLRRQFYCLRPAKVYQATHNLAKYEPKRSVCLHNILKMTKINTKSSIKRGKSPSGIRCSEMNDPWNEPLDSRKLCRNIQQKW